MNSDSIPVDLITEIFSRLPQKSIARFSCLSKLWESILRRPYFTELFLTRSSAKPHILFAIEEYGAWNFFSFPQRLMSQCEKSSVVTAKFHMKFLPDNMNFNYCNSGIFGCGHASGLIYLYGRLKKDVENNYGVPVILNPNTGQYLALPYHLRFRNSCSFFGFDPIDKQFKVLFMASPGCLDDHNYKVMTLGIGKMRRRTIKCLLPHHPWTKGICINGVLYYLGYRSFASSDDEVDETSKFVIVCFDVRSEKFKFIYVQNFCTLINYKGKLCLVYIDKDHWKNDVDAIDLRVWVLEDAEKEEWSKYAYTLRDDKFFFDEYVSIDPVGVTTMGDIIFSMVYYRWKHTFCVFYFNPEKSTLQRVEIQGFGEYYNDAFPIHRVLTFPNHIEDLEVNDPKLLNSSIYAS